METSILTIEIAVLMVAVSFVMILWFQGSETALSAGRMLRMMTRSGLDPEIARRGDWGLRNIMRQSRARCAKCPREDHCERWLAGEIGGGNDFCPNATDFDGLK